ncbi:hypothetical protein BKA57DRAFT_492290 [Linnemannia elongata]|nr:hypothetical protein BKA57DRAFT_492290 [Linnemannia elongata]
MEDTQSFRLIESTDIEEITCYHISEQNVVYWEDIEQVFPGVKHVKNDKVTISMLRDSNGVRIVPHRIKHHPGVVLDVVLSTTAKHIPTNLSVATPGLAPTDIQASFPASPLTNPSILATAEDKAVEALEVTSMPAEAPASDILTSTVSSTFPATSKAVPSFRQIVRKAQAFQVEQRFISSLAPDIQERIKASSNVYNLSVEAFNDGRVEESKRLNKDFNGHLQELKDVMTRNTDLAALTFKLLSTMEAKQDELTAKQEEMKQLQIDTCKAMEAKQNEIKDLQIQALGQLAVIQTRVMAVLTQTYELHEYPIPRLFIVLPQNPSKWTKVNPFTNKFRLYFLCECGEHTKSINSKTKIHHIHLAKHDGYEIARPSEFFQRYGPYVLMILKMLKFGISVAGVAVPAISHLVRADVVDQASTYLQQLKDNIGPGMDKVIDLMSTASVDEGAVIDEFSRDMENNIALEGADLRKLDTFLKDKDGNKVLGDLFRTVTDGGHVKWVCIDHYRENYQEGTANEFKRVMDLVGASFSKKLGRVDARLRSRVLADQFLSVLGKSRSVHELAVDLDWACNMSDVEAMEDALAKSRVSILCLDIKQFQASLGNTPSSASAEAAVHRIMELPDMKVIHIILSKEFAKVSRLQSTRLHKLSFEMVVGKRHGREYRILAEKLKASATLTSWCLYSNSAGDSGAQALSESLKTNSSRTTWDLDGNSAGDNGAQALSEALRTNSTLTTLNLGSNSIGADGAKAMAEALKTNKTLTTLNLQSNSIGGDGAKALAEALKTNKTLTTLNLASNSIGGDGAKALVEALKTNKTLTTLDLQWNSIGDNGAKALAEALKTNSTLTTLNLHSNLIGGDGAKALAEALKTNSTLTTLNLESNSIGGDGAKALAEALKTNSTLTSLDLLFNSIGGDGAKALAEALKTNSTLTTLNLHSNSIGNNGAKALAEALKTNSTLTTLNLEVNSIGGDGGKALAEALETNSTLTTLDLVFNSIGGDGAKALAEALKTNSTLTTLDLVFNSIGDSGAKALAEALKTNSTLTTLNLHSNKIGGDGAKALAEALKTNSTLTTLDLQRNSIGSDGAHALSEACNTNSTVTIIEFTNV